jgi:hypothetical protein
MGEIPHPGPLLKMQGFPDAGIRAATYIRP